MKNVINPGDSFSSLGRSTREASCQHQSFVSYHIENHQKRRKTGISSPIWPRTFDVLPKLLPPSFPGISIFGWDLEAVAYFTSARILD